MFTYRKVLAGLQLVGASGFIGAAAIAVEFQPFDLEKSCSIAKICPGGKVIRCKANGRANRCKIGPDYVECTFYDETGQQQRIYEEC